LSFNIINWTTQENEKAELAKNNYWLAVLHVVVFVIICLVVSQPLTDLANTFIDYQKFPN
jgi:hypothetical protein